MLAAVTATERARAMVIAIGGPRNWDDTKESWRARLARKLRVTPRRVRALLSPSEKLRLSADEYVRIETLYLRADQAVETISGLARDADVRRAAFGESHRGSDEG